MQDNEFGNIILKNENPNNGSFKVQGNNPSNIKVCSYKILWNIIICNFIFVIINNK